MDAQGIRSRCRDILSDWIIFLFTVAVLAWGTHRVVFLAGNDASRWAHIESLVDFHRSDIERSRYNWTTDKVLIDGRHYSNKPPLFSIMGAALYAVLQWCTQPNPLTFASHESEVVWLLTMLLVCMPTAVLMVTFRRALGRTWSLSGVWPLVLTAALVLGTLIGSFTVTLNNHTPAACFLFLAFQNILSGRRAWLAGFWCGLATGIDLLPGLLLSPLWAYSIARRLGPRHAVGFLGVLLAWLLILGAMDWFTTGTLLTPKMHPRATEPSAREGPMIAGVALPDDPLYPLYALCGYHGVFSVTPILVFGVWGLVRCWRTGKPIDRWTTGLTGAGCAVMLLGHLLLVGWYGGWSYGFRYLIPIVPLVMFYVPVVCPTGGGVVRWLFLGAAVPSVIFAMLGSYHPWPPTAEQVSRWAALPRPSHVPTNPVGASAAAWAQVYLPSSTLSSVLGRVFVDPDGVARDRYLSDFYQSKRDCAAMQLLARSQADRGDLEAAMETATRAWNLAVAQKRNDIAERIRRTLQEIEWRRKQRQSGGV